MAQTLWATEAATAGHFGDVVGELDRSGLVGSVRPGAGRADPVWVCSGLFDPVRVGLTRFGRFGPV